MTLSAHSKNFISIQDENGFEEFLFTEEQAREIYELLDLHFNGGPADDVTDHGRVIGTFTEFDPQDSRVMAVWASKEGNA